MALAKDDLKAYQLCCFTPGVFCSDGTTTFKANQCNSDAVTLCLLLDKLDGDGDQCWVARIRAIENSFDFTKYQETHPPLYIPIYNARLEFPAQSSLTAKVVTTSRCQHNCGGKKNEKESTTPMIYLSKFETQTSWYYLDLERVLQTSVASLDTEITRQGIKYIACHCSIELINASATAAIQRQGLPVNLNKTANFLASLSKVVVSNTLRSIETMKTTAGGSLDGTTRDDLKEGVNITTDDDSSDAPLRISLQESSPASSSEPITKSIQVLEIRPDEFKFNIILLEGTRRQECVCAPLRKIFWLDPEKIDYFFNTRTLPWAKIKSALCIRIDDGESSMTSCYICPIAEDGVEQTQTTSFDSIMQPNDESLIMRLRCIQLNRSASFNQAEVVSQIENNEFADRVLLLNFNLCAHVSTDALQTSDECLKFHDYYTIDLSEASIAEAFQLYLEKYDKEPKNPFGGSFRRTRRRAKKKKH